MADRGSIASAQGWAFERFVRELVARMTGAESDWVEQGRVGDVGVDIAAESNGVPLLVEVKTQTPQTNRRLGAVVAQLNAAAAAYEQQHTGSPKPRLVIAFPGVLSPRKLVPPGLEVWDGRFLQREARRLGVLPPPFLAYAEGEEPEDEREPAEDLLRRLPRIRPGATDWRAYEKFCEDMLGFLFCPPLNQLVLQSSTENGVNRRDFILPNYAQDGFWSFVRVHYHGDFVVAEAKNYSEPIRKMEVLQLANYLTRHGTGLVGMLLTRHGLRSDAKWTSREQWLLHDKLIIGLDDEDTAQHPSSAAPAAPAPA